jgi:hypothetical protein
VIEPGGILCVLFIILPLVVCVGHGIWLLVAYILRALAGPSPQTYTRHEEPPVRHDPVESELRDLAVTERELRRLFHREAIDAALLEQLMAAVRQRRTDLILPATPPVSMPAATTLSVPIATKAPVEEPLDVLPVTQPTETQPQPIQAIEPPIVVARRPRRTVGEVLSAFMEEHNILWGELAGGLLIVGCSVALVVYLWQTQKEIRYFPFFVVAGVTAALFGAGVYAERRWKLDTTSRGLLIIATLLVPLSFLVLAGLSRGEEGGWSEIATQLAALGGFAWLVSLAGRVLTGAEQMPGRKTGHWWLAATVMVSSGMQVLVPRVVNAESPGLLPFLVLGVAATAFHLLATGVVLSRARDALQSGQVHALFAFVGIATFPLLVALGFLVYWCNDPVLALERTAALVAVAGVPVLATGVLVHTSNLSGPLRAVGTSIALGGMLILLAAVAMAWPLPIALVAVCVVNFVVLSTTAWRFRLPVLYAAALPCLAVGYLTGYHLVTGGLNVARAELGTQLVHLALTGASGGALTALAVALAIAAELIARLQRKGDSIYHAVGAGVLAAISLALVTQDGADYPGRAALVYAICGLCGLFANARWSRPWLTYAGALACFCGIAYGLHWNNPDLPTERQWLLALLAYATAMLVGSFLLQPRFRSVLQTGESVDPPSIAVRVSQAFIVPLRCCALISSFLAPIALIASLERDRLAEAAGYGCWLALIWLVLALNLRSAALFSAFQLLLYASLAFAVTAWLDARGWIEKWPDNIGSFRSLHVYGICLAGLSLLYVIARLLLRANPRAWQLLEPQWPAIDRVVLGMLVFCLLGMAVIGISPAVGAEWSATDEYSSNFTAAATGPSAWLLLGVLILVIGTALWDRLVSEAALGLLFLALTVPLLIAGAFADDRSSASAVRWGLSIVFVICSAGIWLRASLARFAAEIGIKTDETPRIVVAARGVLIALAAAPVLALTAVVASLQIAGEPLGGPVAGSLFDRMGPLASALTPLVLVVAGLVGYSVRERVPGYAFAAGIIADLTLMGGYILGVITGGGRIDGARGIFTVQLGAIGAAVWAGACLLSRRRFQAWREGPENLFASPLMGLQLGISACFNAYLVFIAILLPIFLRPQETLADGQLQIGQAAGWLGLLACAGVIYWYVSGDGLKSAGKAKDSRIHVLGTLGVGIVALAASALNPTGEAWTSYHVLIAAGSVYALGILVAGILAVHPQLLQSLIPAESDQSETKDWSKWLAELLPARAVHGWLHGITWPLVYLALRGGWSDPERPYWSVAGIMAACIVTGALAVWSRRQAYTYVSGILANLAGILIWISYGPVTWTGFLAVVVLGLAIASIAWSGITIALHRSGFQFLPSVKKEPFAHWAVTTCIAALIFITALHVEQGWKIEPLLAEMVLAWMALAVTAVGFAILFWDMTARDSWVGLYLCGLLAVILAPADMHLTPDRFWWVLTSSLAVYVLATTSLRRISPKLSEFGHRIGIPERARGWPVEWLIVFQACASCAVVLLSIWIVCSFDLFADRVAGPLATALLLSAAIVFAGVRDRGQKELRYVALALGVIVAVEFGWSLLDPSTNALGLHRNALLLVALAVMTAFYGLGFPRLLRPDSEWLGSVRRAGPVLAVLSAVQLLIVLGHEAALYDPVLRTTPLAWWGVLAVAIGFALLAVAVLCFAVMPGRDPLGLSEQRRTLYVYAAELLAVLLLVHLRINVPDLFPPFVGRYWPLVIMGIAFLGVGLSEWFHRIGSRVLSEPLRRTSVFLPILPLIAYWVRDWTGLREAAAQNVPALSPLLKYLERLEGGFGLHASVWFILGMLYAVVAVSRRSFKYAMLGAVAANFGLWVVFAHVEGMEFVAHPQLWLIPLALILLVAEHLNRDKLSEPQATSLRYLALTVLYVSSTADMFIAGIGNSVMLPIVLALLSVLGILIGILLRVRAFLFQGLTFLFVVVLTMIWHAAVQRGQTWVWYVSGIILGAGILALFALFEKRRNEVVKVVQELKRWE